MAEKDPGLFAFSERPPDRSFCLRSKTLPSIKLNYEVVQVFMALLFLHKAQENLHEL